MLMKTNPKTAAALATAENVHCCVSGCGNSELEHPGKVFYVFPEAPDSWAKWLEAIDRPDLSETLTAGIPDDDRVCSDHFAPWHYTSRRALRGDAVPRLQPYNPDEVGQVKKWRSSDNTIEMESEGVRDGTAATAPYDAQVLGSLNPRGSSDTEAEETISQSADPTAEDLISILIETRYVEKDPLALVKSEPGEPQNSVTTQTFTRKELYLNMASSTDVELLELPQVYSNLVKRNVVCVQTTKDLLYPFLIPVKRKLVAEIREINKKTKFMESPQMDKPKFMKCCEKYLNEKIANIVKSHSHIQEKYVGNRYGHDFKTFALNLYLSNPQSYKFVEQIFNLPSKTTLQRLQTPARTGINPNLMEYLKMKVTKMSDTEKVCAICFDVMRVSNNLWYEAYNDFFCGMQEIDQVMGPEPAEYAAVLMVHGLYTKWTIPVSFALMSEKRCYPELKEWIHKIIGIMFDVGLNIKVFVSDLETEFIDVFVKPESHYFEIDGRRIYQFYDMRYLFKSARDALMQYNFHLGTKVAQWNHILKVYDKDKTQYLSLMPKITEKHVRPAEESLRDVNLAIQVFSNTVAAAMNFHVTANMVSQKVRDTIEFITKMSNLFDTLNSKTIAGAYRGTSEQNQVLLSMLEYLQALEARDRHGNVMESRFATGMMVNIRSVMALLQDLKQESLQYVFTKALSKDCAEAFFDICRRLGGNCCERPTSIMFARSFRRLFMVSLVHSTRDGVNEQDLKSTLYKIGEYLKADIHKKEFFSPNESLSENFRRILAGVSDYKIQWPSTEYIAGYLLWKCLERHHCTTSIEKLSSLYDIPVESDAATLIKKFKKYNAHNIDSVRLMKPPEALVAFVDHMDQKYCEYFSRTDREPVNFGSNTYRTMEEDTFELPCDCFPLKFMKVLFIRLKIEHCVRGYNKNNKTPRRPRHQQMKMKHKRK